MRTLIPILVIVAGLMSGCMRCDDSTDEVRRGQASDSCKRLSDCESPLVCVEERCVPPSIVDPTPSEPESVSLEMLPKRVRRPILVGGCMEECDRPKVAVRNFLIHVLQDKRDEERIRSFIDTSLLVHNGKAHGEEWANLFLDDRLVERTESIEQWLAEWLKWGDLVVDPLDRRYDDAAVHVHFQDQNQYTFDYHRPDLRDHPMKSLARVWRFTLKKRGLEWLVMSIDDVSKGIRSRP